MVYIMKNFDPNSPCLVLAPHLEYPLRNGADILIDRKWSQFSEYVPFVDIIGKNRVSKYKNGQLVNTEVYENINVSKYCAAFKTILNCSHYLLEKFLTDAFIKVGRKYLSRPEYKTVILSFIYTSNVLKKMPINDERLYCIETHNDELRWFSRFMKGSINPGVILAAFLSKRWARTFLKKHDLDFLYIHVSKTDQVGYLSIIPSHRSIISPVGVEEEHLDMPDQEEVSLSEKVRLIFVGSLSVETNFEALKFFGDKFFPILKENFGNCLEILIVGSKPSAAVERLCGGMGWRLLGNVSDQGLRYLYSISMFSILPFQYTTGGKLKLLKSLGNGVPYLATLVIGDQIEKVLYPCLMSGDAKEWVRHIRTIKKRGVTESERLALIDYAKKNSWSSVAYNMFKSLCYDSFTSKDTKSNDS